MNSNVLTYKQPSVYLKAAVMVDLCVKKHFNL